MQRRYDQAQAEYRARQRAQMQEALRRQQEDIARYQQWINQATQNVYGNPYAQQYANQQQANFWQQAYQYQPPPPPQPAPRPSYERILGPVTTREQAEQAYRREAKKRHPDMGGSVAAMTELNQAIAQARKVLG